MTSSRCIVSRMTTRMQPYSYSVMLVMPRSRTGSAGPTIASSSCTAQ